MLTRTAEHLRITRAITNLKDKQEKVGVISVNYACLSYLCRSAWRKGQMWETCKLKKQLFVINSV